VAELLTTRAAAALLGVGTTSIKRWADEGVLRCIRTPGGHRRYPREAVQALAVIEPPAEPQVQTWVRALLDEDVDALVARLERAHRRHRRWAPVADSLGPVLGELGRAWERGDISPIEEHVASDRLSRALARCGDAIAVADTAPRALLMTAEGEDHTLGLSLLELCLRELGWRTLWSGRESPVAHVDAFLSTNDSIRLVGVSASEAMRDALAMRSQAAILGRACRSRGVALVLGGSGAWPDPPPYGTLVRELARLRTVLAT
jgi:excisionase family DNA binding protein